jgi:hypothetical protein
MMLRKALENDAVQVAARHVVIDQARMVNSGEHLYTISMVLKTVKPFPCSRSKTTVLDHGRLGQPGISLAKQNVTDLPRSIAIGQGPIRQSALDTIDEHPRKAWRSHDGSHDVGRQTQ